MASKASEIIEITETDLDKKATEEREATIANSTIIVVVEEGLDPHQIKNKAEETGITVTAEATPNSNNASLSAISHILKNKLKKFSKN